MYQAPSFSAQPQYPNPDENLDAGGYNHTQPSFVVPGSKAAERNARRKKQVVPVLETVPNHLWENLGPTWPFYSAYHGLMSPKTPGSYMMPMDIDSEGYLTHHKPTHHNTFPAPRDRSNEFSTDNYHW